MADLARLRGVVERNRRNEWAGVVMTTDELAGLLEEVKRLEEMVSGARDLGRLARWACLDHHLELLRDYVRQIEDLGSD